MPADASAVEPQSVESDVPADSPTSASPTPTADATNRSDRGESGLLLVYARLANESNHNSKP